MKSKINNNNFKSTFYVSENYKNRDAKKFGKLFNDYSMLYADFL
jgi:hypothetical protein